SRQIFLDARGFASPQPELQVDVRQLDQHARAARNGARKIVVDLRARTLAPGALEPNRGFLQLMPLVAPRCSIRFRYGDHYRLSLRNSSAPESKNLAISDGDLPALTLHLFQPAADPLAEQADRPFRPAEAFADFACGVAF